MFNLKFSEQLVCKLASLRLLLTACLAIALNFAIATLFAVMFVACSLGGSTEETSMGGSSEDPSFASLENITVRGFAMANSRYESLDSSQMSLAFSGMRKGSVVTLYELDSLSMDSTGVFFADTVDNADGRFDIQGVTLKSPYALIVAEIETDASINSDYSGVSVNNRNYSVVCAIVDVRDTVPIVVDVISDLVYPRVRFLVKSGIGFAQAMDQAKREIFDALGIYGLIPDSVNVESLDYLAMLSVIEAVGFRSEYVNAGVRVADVFAETGSFASVEWLTDMILYKARALRNMLSIPQAVYDRMGEQNAKIYQSLKLHEKYFAGILSAEFGVGRCTSSLEGKSFGVPDSINMLDRNLRDLFEIVCRSENWHLNFKHVNHTFGTMTDDRDGKTYKTVTIDFGGKTATWMAENLNYNGAALDTTYCYDDEPENCEIYGRQYDWQTATGLGESVMLNQYATMEECRDSLLKKYAWKERPYDSAYVKKCIEALENPDSIAIDKCEYYGGSNEMDLEFRDQIIQEECERAMSEDARFVNLSNVNLDSLAVTQGVCPTGWRIPTFDDWEDFFGVIEGQWNKTDEGAYFMATPSINESFGFGMYNVAKMERNDEDEIQIHVGENLYVFIPTNDENAGRYNSGSRPNLGYAMYGFGGLTFEAYYRRMFVRCVKN